MFGQLTGLQSLRGIVLCLNANEDELYGVKRYLYEILQILSVSQLEKTALKSLLATSNIQSSIVSHEKQLPLAIF